MSISVDPIASPRIITVPTADGASITVQSLVNQIRQWEHEPLNLGYVKLLSASGKEDLGGGTLVGITAKLENTKVKFEARGTPTTCYVGGGNLVAVDANGASMFPIEPSTNVTVQLSQSTSATLVQSADITAIKAKTDNIPSSPASSGEYTSTLSTIDTAVNTKASQTSVDAKPNLSQIEGSSVLAKEATINTRASQTTADSIKTKTDTITWNDVGFIKQVEQGRWRITNNQMIIYADDGETPIATFNCYDGVGTPTVENIYEMRPVV